MSIKDSPQRLSQHLRAAAAAEYIGLAQSTLAKMRLSGDGPVYSKAGPRIVIYDIADLDSYLEGRKRRSTSENIGACQAAAE